MRRYTIAFLAFVTAAVLISGGTFRQSAVDSSCSSFQGYYAPFLGSICTFFSPVSHDRSTRVAAADEDTEDSAGDKDEEDGILKELWESVQLG